MSESLDILADRARSFVREHEHHVMPLSMRTAILTALGPLDRPGGPGHARRTNLAIRVARHALAGHRTDDATTAALDLAPRVWQIPNGRALALEILQTDGNEARDDLRGRSTDRFLAARVAAFEALTVAIRDELFAYPPVADVGTDDPQFGGDDVDTAGVVAVALAGVVGAPDDDPPARLEFWEWWLDQLGL